MREGVEFVRREKFEMNPIDLIRMFSFSSTNSDSNQPTGLVSSRLSLSLPLSLSVSTVYYL